MTTRTTKVAGRISASEEQLASFIDKFDPKHAALIRSVRNALRTRLPTANELVYDNYNFFVIGYCSTERPSDCVVSIAAGANGVGLSFYYGASLPESAQVTPRQWEPKPFYQTGVGCNASESE